MAESTEEKIRAYIKRSGGGPEEAEERGVKATRKAKEIIDAYKAMSHGSDTRQ